MNGALTVNGVLSLTSGNFNTAGANLINLATTATLNGGSNSSYISGPVIRNTDAATGYTFPVGDNNRYRPTVVTPTTTAASAYQAQYFDVAYSDVSSVTSPLTSVSNDEYWDISKLSGSDATVSLSLDGTNSIPGSTNSDYAVVAHYEAGSWVSTLGTAIYPGNSTSGTATSGVLTTFSPFTFGLQPGAPLPIAVEYFKGARQGSNHLLDWKVSCTNTASATLVLERSANGRNFISINTINATALRCLQPFSYTDAAPLAGLNYYRLKMTDADGKTNYSTTIALLNKNSGFDIIGMLPNPVTANGAAILNVTSAQKGKLQLVVTDIVGKQVMQQTETMVAGSNQVTMNFAALAAGTYQVTGYSEDGSVKTVRFVKQ